MQEKEREYSKIKLNVKCFRKTMQETNVTMADLTSGTGKGINAMIVLATHALAEGENVSYEEAQEYIDNLTVKDIRYVELMRKVSDALKKNLAQ